MIANSFADLTIQRFSSVKEGHCFSVAVITIYPNVFLLVFFSALENSKKRKSVKFEMNLR